MRGLHGKRPGVQVERAPEGACEGPPPLLALLPQPPPRPPLRMPRRPLPPVLPPLLAPCCLTHPKTLPDPTPLTGWQRLSGAPPGPRIGGRPREGVSHTEEAPMRGLQWRNRVNGGMMGV